MILTKAKLAALLLIVLTWMGTGASAMVNDPPPKKEDQTKKIKGTTVTGRVLAEPGGKEVVGVVVTLWNGSNGARWTAKTDKRGCYSFSNVAPGDYYKVWIQERPKKGAGIWREHVVVPVKNQPVWTDDLYLTLPQSISGTVTDADSGKPVPGAHLHSSTADRNWDSVSTDNLGRYCLFVAPREVQISCFGTNDRYYASDRREKINVVASQNIKGKNFKLKSAPTFTGQVVFPDGKPVQGLKLRVFVEFPANLSRGASFAIGRYFELKTDDSGQFVGYMVSPSPFGHYEGPVELRAVTRLPDCSMGGLTRGKTHSKKEYRIDPLKIVLAKTASVKFRVVDLDRKPLINAKVTGSDIRPGWNRNGADR
jgi:hypothetical protein